MDLTEKELNILEDTEFLLTKIEVLRKVRALFIDTRGGLTKIVSNSPFKFPAGMDLTKGKISKGEHYQKLPYMVLDFPGLFTAESIFAYRIMFWWGHFFSATLHLQGLALNQYRSEILKDLKRLIPKKVYIGVGDSPWHYHYEHDNYVPLDENHLDLINGMDFIKLSKKIELRAWNELPAFSCDFLRYLLSVMNSDSQT
jgi:hypothetical protein